MQQRQWAWLLWQHNLLQHITWSLFHTNSYHHWCNWQLHQRCALACQS